MEKSGTNSLKVLLIFWLFLRGCGLPHQCAHWFAMTCRRRWRVSGCKDVCAMTCRNMRRECDCKGVSSSTPAVRSCTRAHLPTFCMSLRGAKRRGNPFSLQWGRTKSNTLGEYARRNEFALSPTSLPGFPAGTRIATPVCALVRNDMQKAGALLRLQGGGLQ